MNQRLSEFNRHKKTSSGKGRGANQLPLTIKPYHQWQNRIFF